MLDSQTIPTQGDQETILLNPWFPLEEDHGLFTPEVTAIGGTGTPTLTVTMNDRSPEGLWSAACKYPTNPDCERHCQPVAPTRTRTTMGSKKAILSTLRVDFPAMVKELGLGYWRGRNRWVLTNPGDLRDPKTEFETTDACS